jgi:type II secretory pathway predicted ATPase ExeA
MLVPLGPELLDWFGLARDPFADSVPHAALTDPQSTGASFVRDCIRRESGASLVLGSAGSGKSRLVDHLAREFATGSKPVTQLYVVRGRDVGGHEHRLVGPLARGLGVPSRTPAYRLYHEIEARARRALESGRRMALVVDEAEALGPRPLGALVALWNISTDVFLVQFALVARPEFLETLRSACNRSLESRVGVDVRGLRPMTCDESIRFVTRALDQGGARRPVLAEDARALLGVMRPGHPGPLATAVRRAMVLAYARGERVVTAATLSLGSVDEDDRRALAS